MLQVQSTIAHRVAVAIAVAAAASGSIGSVAHAEEPRSGVVIDVNAPKRTLYERRLQSRLLYATADEACEAAFAGGPVGLAYGRFTDSMKAEAHEEYLASLKPYRVREGYSVPGEFVVVGGTKGGGI
jgi:hypothetical protein